MKLKNVKVGMRVKVKSNPVYGSKAYANSLGKVATVTAIDHEDSEKDVRVLCDGGGYNWLNHADIKMIDEPFKPKVGDCINSARLSVDTIKVGMKVRTLEGTLTYKFEFPVGTEFTVTHVGEDCKHATLKHESGISQSDKIEELTKSW